MNVCKYVCMYVCIHICTYIYIHACIYIHIHTHNIDMNTRTFKSVIHTYGVALVSSIDKIIRLFCKRALENRRYSAKDTYNLIDPTNRSHPIPARPNCKCRCMSMYVHTSVYIIDVCILTHTPKLQIAAPHVCVSVSVFACVCVCVSPSLSLSRCVYVCMRVYV